MNKTLILVRKIDNKEKEQLKKLGYHESKKENLDSTSRNDQGTGSFVVEIYYFTLSPPV